MVALSYQLYSSRDFPPIERTLKMLASLGYAGVEGYGGLFIDNLQVRDALDESGLAMPSAHFSFEALQDDREETLKTAKILGISSIYCPYLPPEDRPQDTAGWIRFGAGLESLAGFYQAEGYHFGWHNHDFEFEPLANGPTPLRLILDAAPSIGWEADLAWIVRGGGGGDPLPWIAEYGTRITAVHCKDIAPAGENLNEDGWADLGHGIMDWPALIKALAASPMKHFVIEHDNPGDDFRFARNSIETAKGFPWTGASQRASI